MVGMLCIDVCGVVVVWTWRRKFQGASFTCFLSSLPTVLGQSCRRRPYADTRRDDTIISFLLIATTLMPHSIFSNVCIVRRASLLWRRTALCRDAVGARQISKSNGIEWLTDWPTCSIHDGTDQKGRSRDYKGSLIIRWISRRWDWSNSAKCQVPSCIWSCVDRLRLVQGLCSVLKKVGGEWRWVMTKVLGLKNRGPTYITQQSSTFASFFLPPSPLVDWKSTWYWVGLYNNKTTVYFDFTIATLLVLI